MFPWVYNTPEWLFWKDIFPFCIAISGNFEILLRDMPKTVKILVSKIGTHFFFSSLLSKRYRVQYSTYPHWVVTGKTGHQICCVGLWRLCNVYHIRKAVKNRAEKAFRKRRCRVSFLRNIWSHTEMLSILSTFTTRNLNRRNMIANADSRSANSFLNKMHIDKFLLQMQKISNFDKICLQGVKRSVMNRAMMFT